MKKSGLIRVRIGKKVLLYVALLGLNRQLLTNQSQVNRALLITKSALVIKKKMLSASANQHLVILPRM